MKFPKEILELILDYERHARFAELIVKCRMKQKLIVVKRCAGFWRFELIPRGLLFWYV